MVETIFNDGKSPKAMPIAIFERRGKYLKHALNCVVGMF